MIERILYYNHEDRRYRIKVRNDMVYIERQASAAAPAKSADCIGLECYPVLEEHYWVSHEIERLIFFHEADYGPVPFSTITHLEEDRPAPLTGQDMSSEDEWLADDLRKLQVTPHTRILHAMGALPSCMPSPLDQVKPAPVLTSWEVEKTSIPKAEHSEMCNGEGAGYRAKAVCTCDRESDS